MKQSQNGGSIINTASIAALSARSGTDAYSAAKAAIVNVTLSAAVRLAPFRIRVNAISPGPILTNMVIRLRGPADQLKRIMERSQPWPEHGRPEHIAGAALFLASDDASFVVGHNLIVDGGMMAAGPRYGDRSEEIRATLEREDAGL
jgi:NAD(P)-dependent dehydrogenase (short-subunit alcohol dehydrogenase family)